jgi:hypothetical protein
MKTDLLEVFGKDTEWMLDANCVNMDQSLFFPDDGVVYSKFAREVCAECPVLERCLWYSNETSSEFGMFAGKSPRERDAWRRSNRVIMGETQQEWLRRHNVSTI